MLLLFFSIRAGAEVPEADEVLQKIVQSFQTVSFRGKLTFMLLSPGGSQMREALVIRKAPDKGRIELLTPMADRGTVIVMNGKARWQIPAGKERGRERRRRFFRPPDRMGEILLRDARILLQHYSVQVLEGGNVADRSTYLIQVKSEKAVRPSANIWADTETGAVLKIEHYDSQRRLRDLLVYSEVDFNPEIDEAIFQRPEELKPNERPRREPEREELWLRGRGRLDLGEVRKAAGLDVIAPKLEPVGFVLRSIDIIRFGERENVHLSYTDGLVVLSVFESESDDGGPGGRRGRGPGGPPREGRREGAPSPRGGRVEKMDIRGIDCEVMSRGPVSIFRWNQNGVYVTLMGELERKEMVEIVSSFINDGG
jgi:outer membrane lipoprotein-sorting protein